MEQMTLWDMTRPPIKIDKPIRLIEIFSGYGSQFMAMKRLGADVTSWLAVDIDKYAIASYNAVHGTNYEPMDVSQIRGGYSKPYRMR